MRTSTEHLHRAKALLETSGIRAVLMYLNSLTAHRFTALYRFDDETLRNLYFFDREKPEVNACPDIPIPGSYCMFVRSGRQTFVTLDSMTDQRVRDHPKRLEVRSYCGVPLIDTDGKMFGTLCHFDFAPQTISDDNLALMEAVARVLQPKKTANGAI